MQEIKRSPQDREVRKGSRVVRIWSNEPGGPYTSTLWVGDGEICTTIRRKAKTLKGARKQAAQMLAD